MNSWFRILIFLLVLAGVSAEAKTPYTILLLGNSFTHYPSAGPGQEPKAQDAYLPKILEVLIESIHPDLDEITAYNTPGNWSFKRHFEDPISRDLLKVHYDAVILQANSLEALELPEWFRQNGRPDLREFLEFGPKLISVSQATQTVLYATWAYHPTHRFFAPEFAGREFEPGHPRTGTTWFGSSWEDMTWLINRAYLRLAERTDVQVARVGRAWLRVHQDANSPVPYDSLFYDLVSDRFHPGYAGSYLAACVLYRSLFGRAPIGGAHEDRLTPAQADYLQRLAD